MHDNIRLRCRNSCAAKYIEVHSVLGVSFCSVACYL